jgi:16S rRNA (uracil1498-N3)-methyltransferase
MRLHRFIGNFDFGKKSLTVVDEEMVSQWRNVLRLATGDKVILCDGRGHEAQAEILDLDKKQARVSIESINTESRDPKKRSELFCALLKRENFELVIQKATEIGIARITPLITIRTVKTGFNRERMEKIIREASEQSGRMTLPELLEPTTLTEAMLGVRAGESVFFDLTGTELPIETFQNDIRSCFIGPEGGFTEEETAQAKSAGLVIASLGKLTLRGETAAIVASFLITR